LTISKDYILHLADNALIMGHRDSEWCGHGPILEQDIAITNIALDYIGQARNFYQLAADIINNEDPAANATEDSLAYLRDVRAYKNALLVELPNGDWAQTVLKQFFFSTYQYFLYSALVKVEDENIAAIAEKSLKEVTYHLKWSSEWVIRLGDGTDESKQRLLKAVDELWNYTGELFTPAPYEKSVIDNELIKQQWFEKIAEVFSEATIEVPKAGWMQSGGKTGVHTEHLGFILAEMQYLQRAYPGCEW
jgi:ring-1,2-phenylacetyl-CoA epoxidase subunit PaaC